MTIGKVKSIPVIAGARRATAITGMDPKDSTLPEQGVTVTPLNPEVPEKPVRRRFKRDGSRGVLAVFCYLLALSLSK